TVFRPLETHPNSSRDHEYAVHETDWVRPCGEWTREARDKHCYTSPNESIGFDSFTPPNRHKQTNQTEPEREPIKDNVSEIIVIRGIHGDVADIDSTQIQLT